MLDRLNRGLRRRASEKLQELYGDSSVRLIYRSHVGVDVYVHPQKLIDILDTDESCDAESWMHAMAPIMKRGEVSLDVGANIGIVSSWLAKFTDAVYAFEPDEFNIEMLKANVELNKASNVTVVDSAVGAYDGDVELFCRRSFGHHSTKREHLTEVVESRGVPMMALDTFCVERGIHHVAFLKVDVEGSEIDVLRGFENYLRQRRVDRVLFEHAPVLLDKHKQTEVFDYLDGFGFVIRSMNHEIVNRAHFLSGTQGDYYAALD